MERRAAPSRCVGVWLPVTVAVAVVQSWLLGDLPRASAVFGGGDLATTTFDDLLAQLAALSLAVCAGWFWLVTTLVTVQAARGVPGSRSAVPGCPAALRRLILAACGLAVASALTAPATATPVGSDRPRVAMSILVGLRLPERATAQQDVAHQGPRREPRQQVQVRVGDTLWSLAAATLPSSASDAEIASAWRAVYERNRSTIGSDPDLIVPGTTLSIPHPQERTR